MTDKKEEILKQFDEKFESPKTLWAQDKNKKWYGKKEVKEFLSQALSTMEQEVRKTIIEALDLEVEAWMAVHEKQERTFQTKDFINHLRKTVLKI